LLDERYNKDTVLSTAGGQQTGFYDYGCPVTPGLRWLLSADTASCILSDFDCERNGYRIDYLDAYGERRAKAQVNLGGRIIYFYRYSNGLYYTTVKEFAAAATAQNLEDSKIANVSTRSGGGVDQLPTKPAEKPRIKKIVSFELPKLKGRNPHNANDSDSDSSAIPDLIYSSGSEDEDNAAMAKTFTYPRPTPSPTASKDIDGDSDEESDRDSDAVPDLVSHSDDSSDSEDEASEEKAPNEPHPYSTKGTATGYGRKKISASIEQVKREIQQLRSALAFPSIEKLADMIDRGKIHGTDLTKQIVLGVGKLLETDSDSDKMLMAKMKTEPPHQETYSPALTILKAL
jgi:hypothetical protein